MDLNYFDLIVGGIVLLLGLKGILNGFFKELFGLIGIVGGVFVASRFAHDAGMYISNMVFKFNNESAINFTGFLVTLAGFWIAMVIIGTIFKKLVSASGLGIFDKILGFVFGASKFFLIGSIIVYAVYNMKTLKPTLDEKMHSSMLFPVMVETGGFIMKMDPVDNIKQLKQKQEQIQQSIQDTIQEHVTNAVKEQVQSATTSHQEETTSDTIQTQHEEVVHEAAPAPSQEEAHQTAAHE